MKRFRNEVALGDQGRFYDIITLVNARYEVFLDGDTIGTIQLDERDHAHCESQGCELDLPVLKVIREGIQFHENWNHG